MINIECLVPAPVIHVKFEYRNGPPVPWGGKNRHLGMVNNLRNFLIAADAGSHLTKATLDSKHFRAPWGLFSDLAIWW